MNKNEFKSYLSSARSNGAAFTLQHIGNAWDRSLVAQSLQDMTTEDWLAIRARWIANPMGDSVSSLIRLSSTVGTHSISHLP